MWLVTLFTHVHGSMHCLRSGAPEAGSSGLAYWLAAFVQALLGLRWLLQRSQKCKASVVLDCPYFRVEGEGEGQFALLRV